MNYIPDLFLLLFIMNLGIAFGAGLYETQIVIPRYFGKSPKSGYYVNVDVMRQLDVGRKFWAFVTTIPLTLLTLANSITAWQSQQPEHTWWLAAAMLTLVERIGTFAFFIPTAIKFQQSENSKTANFSNLIALWIGLNYIRNGLTLLAWLLALKAFSTL